VKANNRSLAHFALSPALLAVTLALGGTPLALATGRPAPAPTPTLEPQDPIETVFSTNAASDRLLRLDFRDGSAAYVNTDADARFVKKLEGIAVRADATGVSVIAADSVGQRVLFYPDAQGPDRVDGQVIAEVPWPDGVSLDTHGNLFLVSSPVGPRVWTLPVGGSRPGGYGDPVLVDPDVPATILEDTKTVSFTAGSLVAGDLLVVSRVPATIFRYRKGVSGWERQIFIPKNLFPNGSSPTGISFSPRQELLVSTFGGTILRFDSAGARVLPDFARGCGNGRLKIAVGIQEGKNRAFVANRSNGGKILRFLIQPDGTGTPDGDVNERVFLPSGVGIASNSAVPTPAGSHVIVKPAPEVEIDYDVVTTPGLTGTKLIEFVDNRNCPAYACDSQSLRAFFPDDPKLQASLPDVMVPAFARALRKALPGDLPGHATGPETFLLAIIKTTAVFGRTAASHFEEEERGILGTCAGLGPQAAQEGEPRTFYAPETGAPKLEPGLIEGETFIDVSDGCGSNKGSGWNFSLYLTGRDPSTPVQIIDRKIPGLRLAFNSLSSHIANPVASELDGELADAEAAFALFRTSGAQADKDATLAALEAFRATVDANPGAFDNAGAHRNVSGELVARTNSTLFILPKAPVTAPVPSPFSITIGDNDGYGNAFGLLNCPVGDNQSFPPSLIGRHNSYTPRDGRSEAEKGAQNGAEQTDFYSALQPGSGAYGLGLPSSFDLVFPVTGTLTSAKFELDMGSFQASECSQIGLKINGVAQPGFLAFSDGALATRVRKITFSEAQLEAANLARPLKITLSRGSSTDKIAFDYFKLSGEVIP